MDAKEAKEIISAGFAWANWTEKQKQAFKLAYEAINKTEIQKELINKTYTILGNSDLDEKAKLDNLYEIYYN